MRKIKIVDYIEERENYSAVYRQGDIDGACGVYSIIMALDILDVLRGISNDDFAKADGRTRFGKLKSALKKLGKEKGNEILFSLGANVNDLNDLILKSYSAKIETEFVPRKSVKSINYDVLKETVSHLDEGHLVILGLNGRNLAHWVLAIGYEQFYDDNDSVNTGKITRILTLDPSENALSCCMWNSYLDRTAGNGLYPHEFVGESGRKQVKCDESLALWRK